MGAIDERLYCFKTSNFHLSLHLVEEEIKYREYKYWVFSRDSKASDHFVFTYEQPQSENCDLCFHYIQNYS